MTGVQTCALPISLLDEEEADLWHTVKAQISSERGVQRHRASADARLLQLTVQRLRHWTVEK